MARIAQEHDATVAPVRQRLAFENRPLVAIGACFQHRANIGMKTFVRLAQLFHVSFCRPRFARNPLRRFRHAGHKIKFGARRVRVVDDDVAVGAPPLGPRRSDIQSVEQGRRKNGAVRDAPFVNRLSGPKIISRTTE